LSWPLLRRRTQSPTATDTIDYQPSPVPATNGQTPTVIGRTTSMFSPAKAITAGAIVFAIGGTLFIAQPFSQQESSLPGVATVDPGLAPAFFSGTMGDDPTWTVNALPATEPRDDGVVEGTGESYTYPWDANDPRISGMATTITNETDYREGATTLAPTGDVGTVRTGLIRIVNDEGSWEGPFTEFQIDNLDYEQSAGWLTGTGAYEGLTAYAVWVFDDRSIRGHISAEGPPPVPESLPE
jgi:hypothetical protein